ncbi:MAG TPA: sugar ABC transporter substrate-binding protein [Kiritimatiellia bacterium]|nr:sugar ABC transporter substrate-binding protein [Kiritimatiellia bacterium]HPS07980.1 sugar ABC transporter substrate-binding protein [Kiritimatiellia bacterium]
MKRFCAVLLALLCGCGRSGSPEARDGRPVIGVSLLNLSNEFVVTLREAMEARAKELGVMLIVNDAQRSPERQVQQIETFIAQKVDAVVLNPCEVEASSPAVEKALAAGIPVVNVNSVTKAVPSAFVGSRDEESARLGMAYIAERLQGQGGVLMMEGYMGQAAQIKRSEGASEMLAKHPGLRLLAAQTAEWDRAKAVTLMENWLQAYGTSARAVFAQNDEMAMGVLLALERAGRKKDIVVVGVDAIADALQAVRAGRLDATVFQDGQGQGRGAVETALHLIRKEPVAKETYIPFQLVTKENAADFTK